MKGGERMRPIAKWVGFTTFCAFMWWYFADIFYWLIPERSMSTWSIHALLLFYFFMFAPMVSFVFAVAAEFGGIRRDS